MLLALSRGNQAGGHFMHVRARQQNFESKTTRDGGNQHQHESFNHANAKPAEPKNQQRIRQPL